MRGLYDAVHSFTGGAYRLVSPTAEQEKSKVPWKSAHRVQFSFAGEIYFFSTAADYIATAQKSIENAYSMTTTQSSNVTDEALVQGVSAELRKAWSDCNLQNVLTYMYEKSQSETIRKWETAPGTGRALKEADRDSGIASLASWYASYRKELADLRSKINRITSYSGKAATPTPTPTRKS